MQKKKYSIKGIDIPFLVILLTMIIFGLIMVFSASAPSAFYNEGDKLYYIKRQLLFTCMGTAAMVACIVITPHVKRLTNLVFYISVGLLLLVLAIGSVGGGAQRWLSLGPIRFQPSELVKFSLVLYFARRISERAKNDLLDFRRGLLPYLLILVGLAGVMILQDHLSGMIMIMAAGIIVLIVGGANLWHIGFLSAFGAVGVGLLAVFEPYRFKRLIAFADPFAVKMEEGWQIVQGLYAVASGGLFGLGLGQSRQKFLYIPEAHNDYIYAIICEELGFAGAILVAVLFALLIYRGIYIALQTKDTFSSLTVFGIIAIIGLQYLINVGVVTSTIPNTGMQLPFFSAGGSSLIFMMAAMGVVLGISRQIKPKGAMRRKEDKK